MLLFNQTFKKTGRSITFSGDKDTFLHTWRRAAARENRTQNLDKYALLLH